MPSLPRSSAGRLDALAEDPVAGAAARRGAEAAAELARRDVDARGAVDAPDLKFVDSNCDGIDGTAKKAIFASPLGKGSNAGTKSSPMRQIDAAVAAAAAAGKDVYAAAGTYGRVEAATGVNIYGGYHADDWAAASVPSRRSSASLRASSGRA